MIDKVNFRNSTIRYKDEGSGSVVVLLHGYLESLNIWDKFSDELSKKFRVICIDLPGHGQSGIVADAHTMEIMAEGVDTVLNKLHIDKCVLIGHSMGGYVTMAYADLYSNRLHGYSLFHSTPFADTGEKKQNRDREIEMVIQGKKELISKTNIPKAFANDNLDRLKGNVELAIKIANETPDEGIKAVLEGIKQRYDKYEILKNSPIPVLLIFGRKDNYISFKDISGKIILNKKGELLILEKSGHMGFIEEMEESLTGVSLFIEKCAG